MKSCTCSSPESPTAGPRPSFHNCDRRDRARIPSGRLTRKPSKFQTTVEVTRCRFGTTSRQAIPVGHEGFVPQKDWAPIFHAVYHDREAALRHFLHTGVSPDTVEGPGISLLCIATACGHFEIVKTLLEAGASINIAPGDKGETALHIAVQNNNHDIVDLLLAHRANLETQTSHTGQTALHYASAGSSSLEMVTKLLKSGSRCEIQDLQDRTPAAAALQARNLHAAVAIVNEAKGDPKQLVKEKTLLLQQVDDTEGRPSIPDDLVADILRATCEADSTELIEAIKRNNAKAVERFLDQGADVHLVAATGMSPITVAVKFADLRIIKLLVQHGADVTIKGPGNLDILQLLFKTLTTRNEASVVPIVEYLIAKGADVMTNYPDSKTLLHRAVSSQVDHAQVVKLLIKEGVALNAQDTDGNTALHLAAANGLRYSARTLLAAHADTAVVDSQKRTALLRAVQKKQWGLVPLLAVSPAITSWDAEGSTALHHIARSTPGDCGSWNDIAAATKPFCEKGICRSMRDQAGATPLIVAVRTLPEEGLPVIESLLTKGEKKWNCVGHEDHKMRDSLYYAAILNKLVFVQTLLDHGAPFVLEEWTNPKRQIRLPAHSKSRILELILESDRSRKSQQESTRNDTIAETQLGPPQTETRASSGMSGYHADCETEQKSKVDRGHLRKATSTGQLRVSLLQNKPEPSALLSRSASTHQKSRETEGQYRKLAHHAQIVRSPSFRSNQQTTLATKTTNRIKQSRDVEGINITVKAKSVQQLRMSLPQRTSSVKHLVAESPEATNAVLRANRNKSPMRSPSKRISPTRDLQTVEEHGPHAEVIQTPPPPPPKAITRPLPAPPMLTLATPPKPANHSVQLTAKDTPLPLINTTPKPICSKPSVPETPSPVITTRLEVEKPTQPARIDSGMSLARSNDTRKALPELDRLKSALDDTAPKSKRQSGDEFAGWLAISNMLDRI
jgi:ankyrin repeat protein